MANPGKRASPETPDDARAEIAAYIAALSAELTRIARRGGLPTLAYLLDMARLEAEEQTRDPLRPNGAGRGSPSGEGVDAP